MKYLKHDLQKYKLASLMAPLFKMLEATFDLMVPLVVARMINVGINQKDTGYILACCLLLILMALIGLACSFTAQYFAAKAAIGSTTGLRHRLFKHIQSLDFASMDTIGTSTLITRMTSDLNQVQNGLNLFLRLFLRSPFIVFGSMVMAFTIDAKLALIFVIVIPLLSVVIFGIMAITSPRYRKIQGHLDRVTGLTRENLTGVRVIRAFGREEEELAAFSQANDVLVRAQLKVGHLSSLMNPVTYVIINIGIVAILYAGAGQVHAGVLLSGQIVALVNYMNQILVELVKLANLIVTISRALASLGRVEQILDTQPEMHYPEKMPVLSCSEEAVRFEHVSLSYAKASLASLTDISFEAKVGQTIGIIGGTGSGKSSLVHLIGRFYDASAGHVYLNGADITQWPREQLRKHVAIVMQKPQLFAGTIRSNLLWGNPDASEAQLWEALHLAQAADFVQAKTDGLDEVVEQGGRNLSGGQKQRLTIARALVAKPDILILDDSASALDYATDAALRQALASLTGKMTVFIVSQRTSSIAKADHILVLDDGHLVDQGTHQQLLKRCSVYQEIYASQFQKGEDHT